MGGGDVSKDRNQERAISQHQMELGDKLFAQQEARTKRMDEMQAPLVTFLQSIIGGDKGAQTQAVAPELGQIAKGYEASKENIFNNMPAGAGRDVALAQLGMGKNSETSGLLNSLLMNAFPQLANAGRDQGQLALQQLGGGLRSTEGASQSTQNALQADTAAKASTMGLLGQIAGAGGTAWAGHH